MFPLWNLILSCIRVTGTDDDLPNPGIIRASKGLACSGIMAIASGPMSSDKDLRDMEFQVHCIEIEAYSAVLRAFIAQSNDLSWVPLIPQLDTCFVSISGNSLDALKSSAYVDYIGFLNMLYLSVIEIFKDIFWFVYLSDSNQKMVHIVADSLVLFDLYNSLSYISLCRAKKNLYQNYGRNLEFQMLNIGKFSGKSILMTQSSF